MAIEEFYDDTVHLTHAEAESIYNVLAYVVIYELNLGECECHMPTVKKCILCRLNEAQALLRVAGYDPHREPRP